MGILVGCGLPVSYLNKHRNGQRMEEGICGCLDDPGTCCYGYCCSCCLVKDTANDLGQPGVLYCLLSLLFPCIPILLMRQQARERYNIEGDTGTDVAASCFCASCVLCQTAGEVKARGDHK